MKLDTQNDNQLQPRTSINSTAINPSSLISKGSQLVIQEEKQQPNLQSYLPPQMKQQEIQTEGQENNTAKHQKLDLLPIQQKTHTFLGVHLKPSITAFNFFCYLICNFEIVQNLSLLSTAGTTILTSTHYYAIDKSNVGTISGNLNFLTQLYQVMAQIITGSFHDLFGRRIMFLGGYLFMIFGVFVYPYCGSIYPWLFLVRIALAQGFTHILVNPLVADYVKDQTKGLATAYGALAGGAGAMFSWLILLYMGRFIRLEYLFIISGGILVISWLYTFKFLKNYYKEMETDYVNEVVEQIGEGEETKRAGQRKQKKKSCCLRMKEKFVKMWRATRSNKIIPLAFLGTFVSKCLDITLTVYMTLYLGQFYEDDKQIQRASSIILGISSVVGIIIAMILGKLLDKVEFQKLLIPTYFVCGVGYIAIGFVEHPSSTIARVLLIISSSIAIGSNVVVTVMIIKSIKDEARGTILGVYVFCGSLGILLMSKLGGEAFDSLGPSSPFVISGIFAVLYSILILVLVLTKFLSFRKL